MPVMAGPIAPLSPPRSTVAPSTMLSRMTTPTPVGATLAKAISSAPATRSLLPQPSGVNPSTLAPQSSYDYTATSLQPAKVGSAILPKPTGAAFFGSGGATAPSSPTPASSSWTGGSPSALPSSNAMIPAGPVGQTPDPGAAAMLAGGGGGSAGLPSGGGATKATNAGTTDTTKFGLEVPTWMLVAGVAALVGLGAFAIHRAVPGRSR